MKKLLMIPVKLVVSLFLYLAILVGLFILVSGFYLTVIIPGIFNDRFTLHRLRDLREQAGGL